MVSSPESPSSTIALIQRYKGGDQAALNELCERYYSRIFRLVRVELCSGPIPGLEPEDVAQDVFHRVIERIDDYQERPDAKWISWVATVTRNVIFNHRRDAAAGKRGGKRRTSSLHTATGSWAQIDAQMTSVLSRMSRSEAAQRVDAFVPRLPEEHRRVVILRDYEGHEWAEVGRQMQRSPKACQQMHARARLELLRLMRQ